MRSYEGQPITSLTVPGAYKSAPVASRVRSRATPSFSFIPYPIGESTHTLESDCPLTAPAQSYFISMLEIVILVLCVLGPFLLVGLSCAIWLCLQRVGPEDDDERMDYGGPVFIASPVEDEEKSAAVQFLTRRAPESGRTFLVHLLRSRWETGAIHLREEDDLEYGAAAPVGAAHPPPSRPRLQVIVPQ